MNYAKQILRSARYKLQSALDDLDKTNHTKLSRGSIEIKIESIDSLLRLSENIESK